MATPIFQISAYSPPRKEDWFLMSTILTRPTPVPGNGISNDWRPASSSPAGKTGTAQVYGIAQDEEYDEDTVIDKLRDHALFVSYAPAEKPQIAVAVIVENGGHGSSVAAPIARRIMDAYLLEKL